MQSLRRDPNHAEAGYDAAAHPASAAVSALDFPLLELPDPAGFARMNTAEIRAALLVEDLFTPGHVQLRCSSLDRAVIGTAVPAGAALPLPSSRELAAEYLTERREIGVVNIGGPGQIEVETQRFSVGNREALYIGRGNRNVVFSSLDSRKPAQFYFVSHPAHVSHPCVKVGSNAAESREVGSSSRANRRTIHKLIHPGAVASCQLVMGYTELAEGCVWNTMPAHTHGRRSEIYLYFDLPDDEIVLHCAGRPGETRHIVVRDRQAVLSPAWSLHCGAGTAAYSFIWSMGGENQEFADMDAVSNQELR
jgi:4-deoxy-L-threo-5-hexosulose-uronate ketol-isomerase